MKCEVCGTKIPIGSHECPNCGYKWKAKHVNTFDASSQNHEHIRSKQVLQKTDSHHFMKLFYVILFIGIISMVLSIIVPFIMSRQVNQYENLSFNELIDKGYDDQQILTQAKEAELQIKTFFENELLLNDVDIDENSYIDGDTLSGCSFEVNGQKNFAHYGIKYQYNNGQLFFREMYIMGESSLSIQYADNEVLDEKTITSIADFLEFNEAKKLINKNRVLMKEDDNEQFVYSDYENDTKIYMSEEMRKNDGQKASYHYYISIYQENKKLL